MPIERSLRRSQISSKPAQEKIVQLLRCREINAKSDACYESVTSVTALRFTISKYRIANATIRDCFYLASQRTIRCKSFSDSSSCVGKVNNLLASSSAPPKNSLPF